MPLPLILGTNAVTGGYDVANSVRFDGSSAYMNKTFGTPTNNKKWTYSFWIKKSGVAGNQAILGCGADGNNRGLIYFADNGKLYYYETTSGTDTTEIGTNRLFRDPSAWYHIVVAVDTSQGTEANRVKIYVNGTQETSLAASNYPSQDATDDINSAIRHDISGRNHAGSSDLYLNGYMAEVVFIDGQQLAPTSFGEFDEDSPTHWKPINVSGLTFGNNGFYLDFEVSDTLGNDANGGTDFSINNLAATDQSTDTCTNNFATMNPLSKGSNITISEGNLKVSNGGSDNSILGNIGFGGGKWYWEAKCTGATTYANIGVTLASADGTTHSTVDAGRVVYSHNGYVYKEGLSGQSNVSGLATFTTNDIVSVAYDGENGSVKFYKNGTLVNTTTDSDLEFSNNEYITSIGMNQGGFELNFGSPPYSISSGNADANGHGNFEYAVPSGYFALCTKNLAEHG